MQKLKAAFRKEFLQLISDKVGLFVMFVMPIVLVIIVTVIQDGAFKVINQNKVSLVLVNNDKGQLSKDFVLALKESGMFDVESIEIKQDKIISQMLSNKALTALHIPKGFSEKVHAIAKVRCNKMLKELGLDVDSGSIIPNKVSLNFYHDPTLQFNYVESLKSLITSEKIKLENKTLISLIYDEMGAKKDATLFNKVDSDDEIKTILAAKNDFKIVPNSTQHNIPAWTIFALFFMVVSLGSNVVREKVNGSFIRLKMFPKSFGIVLAGKTLMYLFIGLLQIFFLLLIGVYILPLLGLPKLVIPSEIFSLLLFSILVSLSAVTYSLAIGSFAKTQEQSNGLGAIIIMIFAAIGGIWIPVFVMNESMQSLAMLSPFYWCLDGYYGLFLKGNSISDLMKPISVLVLFNLICIGISAFKLKTEKII